MLLFYRYPMDSQVNRRGSSNKPGFFAHNIGFFVLITRIQLVKLLMCWNDHFSVYSSNNCQYLATWAALTKVIFRPLTVIVVFI